MAIVFGSPEAEKLLRIDIHWNRLCELKERRAEFRREIADLRNELREVENEIQAIENGFDLEKIWDICR